MKTSVIIVAHNEEVYIAHCIQSLLAQTKRADEIVLIAHNCTDQTEIIAHTYPVTVVSFRHPGNVTNGRIEAMRHVTGDVILCIDGDSYAAENWIEEMTKTLNHSNTVLVGSWVRFQGTVLHRIANIFNKLFCAKRGAKAARWIWGASMAFWGRDIVAVRVLFERTFEYSQLLGLTRNVDDFWLALYMGTRGTLQVTNKTWVATHVSERSTFAALVRNRENLKNGSKMEEYVKLHPDFSER